MMKLLVPLLFLAAVSGRRIQTPFVGYQVTEGIVGIGFDALIGTPEQKLWVQIGGGYAYTRTDFYVPDVKKFGYGFDPEKSSTFVGLKNITNREGSNLNATDTINLNGSILKTKPIQVIYETEPNYPPKSRIGLDRYNNDDFFEACPNDDNCTTFIQSVLQDFDEKVLVFAFDKIQNYPTNNFTGQLIFGETPKDLCESVWGVLPELPFKGAYSTQWTFKIDEVSVGKYAWKKPEGQVLIDLTEPTFYVSQSVYNALLKTIGGSDSYFPCNATANVVFNLGGVDVNVGPEIYTWKSNNGKCGFHGGIVSDPFNQIPVLALSNYCLLYDYKDFGLKIAKRVQI